MSSRVQFEYDKELMDLSVRVDNGFCTTISVRELEPMEKILSILKIPYESFVGGMMSDMDYLKFQYDNDSLYKLGVEAGIKQMMDKIEKCCELGKGILCNDKLYFFTDVKQNITDIDAGHGTEREKKYIVPISITYNSDCVVSREVIIKTNRPETAMLIAIGDFQRNGWIVDTDYNNYKTME